MFFALLWASSSAAFAGFDESKAWFDELGKKQRMEVQTDLILLGFYQLIADGKFGKGTFEAVKDFQESQSRTPTGVMTAFEQRALRHLASQVDDHFGMERVKDETSHVALTIPGRLLSIRSPTDVGTSYSSEDGEISLETMRASLTEHSFRELFESVSTPDAERKISYDSFGKNRFVVRGTLGDYSFYTMFVTAGGEAVGYSLAWGKSYDDEGSLASVWIGSHFSPLPRPDGDTTAWPSGPPPVLATSFSLPADRPDTIVLNSDITGATPADFDRALMARPGARTVVLASDGGRVDSALIVAREVRRRGLQTYVAPNTGCYSACAYIFFAGVDRVADGELGVHQITAEIKDLIFAQATLGDVLDALQEFGVDQKVISHMLKTPPDDMYIFTPVELASLGINRGVVDPSRLQVADTTPSPVEADPNKIFEPAFVHLASQSTEVEAKRSLDYANGRWSGAFQGAKLEISAEGNVFQVRLPVMTRGVGDQVCAAIKADGGGCYVTGG